MANQNVQNGTFLSAGQLVGRLCAKAASDLGLPEGIPVGSGVIDAYAGWIGTVGAQVDGLASGTADDDDMLQASTRLAAVAGTSTCHLALAPGRDAVFVPGVWGPYRDVVVPGYWMAEGGQSATGELLRHVVSTHPAYEEARRLAGVSGKEGGIGAVYGYLNSRLVQLAAKRKTPGSGSSIGYLARHIFFYGDLWGNRSPVADETMRGAVVGLDSDVTVDGLAVLYYAAMEGIALQTRQIVETMNSRGHAIRSIFLSGSQALNPILVQLLANACRMPVVVPRYVAAAVVHGTTMLAVKAASEAEAREALAKARDDKGKAELGESLWSIMKRMTKPGKVVHPVPEGWEMKLLDAKYTVFLELCRTQREYRSTVDEAIKRWE